MDGDTAIADYEYKHRKNEDGIKATVSIWFVHEKARC